MHNRFSGLFGKPVCRCCRIRKRLRRLARDANAVEVIAGCVEFVVPSESSYAQGTREVGLWINAKAEPARVGADLRTHTAAELRKVALTLTVAADRLEGGAA